MGFLNIKLYSYLAFVLLLLNSCSNVNNNNNIDNSNSIINIDTIKSFHTNFKYIKNIDVKNIANNKLLTIKTTNKKIIYLLHSRGAKINSNWAKADFIVDVPVNNIATLVASSIGFLNVLNCLDKVKAISRKKYIYNKIIRDRIDSARILELGELQQLDYEKLLTTRPNLFIQSNYNDGFNFDDRVTKAGINTLILSDWKETSPLGRAEWIKVIALFVGKEQMADSIFSEIENKYTALKKIVSNISKRKTVLLGAPFKDIWYMPAGGSYKAQLLNDAGIDYKWKSELGSTSLPLSLETVITNQADADVWIECPYKTYKELFNQDSRFSVFKAYKNKNIYHYKRQIRKDGANNYWERGVGRPDEILSDLIEVFYPDVYKSSMNYYQKLD